MTGPQPYWQSWTFGAAGDILTQTDHAVAGSSAGDTTMTYNYGVAGHADAVSSVSSVNSVTGESSVTDYSYDADGNTTAMGGLSLAWNPGGTLASAGPASYVYDADGDELVQAGPSGTTLFLPGEQLTESASGSVSGMRYYTFAGEVIGESNGSDLYWTEENTQGTLTVAVNAFDQSDPPVFRTLTPYGAVAGASGGSWPDERTFLDDPYDSSTGLVDVGTRQYDPATGLFISVDPVLDTGNPQTMNGYTYCGGDPVNGTDPSGELMESGGVTGSAAYIEDVLARRQQAEQRQYDQLASAVENQQLEDCGCHIQTMRAIAGEYRNPVYVQQQVSRYAATAAYDARLIQ